jgi:hypothetical protein
VSDPALGINYIVDVTSRAAIHEEEQRIDKTSSEATNATTNVADSKAT